MKVLPFYVSTGMRDAERINSQDALLCPVWKFLPFQIQRLHSAADFPESVTLIDCDGNQTNVLPYFVNAVDLIDDWENGPSPIFDYTTFVDDGAGNILTAIESTVATSHCYTVNDISLATGDSLLVNYNLTLNSGTLPNMLLGDAFGVKYSATQQMASGNNYAYLTATGNSSGTVKILIQNEAGNNTSFSCDFIGGSLFVRYPTLHVNERTTYDFITYNGDPLSTTLPYGVYYLKVVDSNATYYSEWFSVENIQPQLLTSWPQTSGWGTFTYSGTSITTAIATGIASSDTNKFGVHMNEKFIFTYDLILNSGDRPEILLVTPSPAKNASNIVELDDGLNEAELTSIKSDPLMELRIRVSAASNFALSSVSLRRKWGDYVHLEFTNSRDFNNGDESIMYASGWTQQAYLRTYLNKPSHETIEVGKDKNGKFVAEKLVSRYTQSLVSYESRSMYNACGYYRCTILLRYWMKKVLNIHLLWVM